MECQQDAKVRSSQSQNEVSVCWPMIPWWIWTPGKKQHRKDTKCIAIMLYEASIFCFTSEFHFICSLVSHDSLDHDHSCRTTIVLYVAFFRFVDSWKSDKGHLFTGCIIYASETARIFRVSTGPWPVSERSWPPASQATCPVIPKTGSEKLRRNQIIPLEGDRRLKLGGGFKYVLCSPRKLGKKNPFWRIFFQMGWNHRLGKWLEMCNDIFLAWRWHID